MFFHEDRLLTVGIDEQPNEEEDWVQRVAISLFNVTELNKPELINRFTPLVGETNYNQSLALDDERVLLLDWNDAFAALPINSMKYSTKYSKRSLWKTGANHLQIV